MSEARITSNSLAHLKFTARWQDDTELHTAMQHWQKFNVWRDIDLLPEPLLDDILGKPVGEGAWHSFNADELVSGWNKNKLITLPLKNFTGRFRNGLPIFPRAGRFYPRGMINGIDGVYHDDILPLRIVEITDDEMLIDYNHPLAKNRLEIKVDIIEIKPASDEHGGRCNEVIEELLDGPGMQIRYQGRKTDFFTDYAFERIDEEADSIFYTPQRNVHHLDAHARDTIKAIYAEHIQPGNEVLDLMASWESHLPENLPDIEVVGLGMNEAELKSNPQLSHYVVHDLNKNPVLSFARQRFDRVICTASIEYLTQPITIFSEIRQLLKPEGKFIVTFSNRWFPTKAVMLWAEMHEFERLGLVADYFREANWSGPVNTISNRGLLRADDDPHYEKTPFSDPVYAVWGEK